MQKINGFNFQNRYLVGGLLWSRKGGTEGCQLTWTALQHQPDKMTTSTKDDLDERKANLDALKRQHGID
jgi:pre-mRNA branch site protein p14